MYYHNLTYPDMNNGEGLRAVLWLSSCPHKCKGCQNPQTWEADSGIPFDGSAEEELFRELDKDHISGLTLSGGDPLFENNLDDVLDLVTEVNKRYNTAQHIDESRKKNHNILNADADEIRLSFPQKTIWLYTGYTWEELFGRRPCVLNRPCREELNDIHIEEKRRRIVRECHVLIDGRYIDAQQDITLPYRGSRNQRIIDIQKSIQKGEAVLWKD